MRIGAAGGDAAPECSGSASGHGGDDAGADAGEQVLEQQVGGGVDHGGGWRGAGRNFDGDAWIMRADEFQDEPGAFAPALGFGLGPERRPVDWCGLGFLRAKQAGDIGEQQRAAIEPVIVDRVDDEVREHVAGARISDLADPDRAGANRGFIGAGGGMVHAPVDFPQALVEFDRDPARAGERGHVLVEPHRVFEREVLPIGRGVALRYQQLERGDHGFGGEQQIEIAQRAQGGVGVGVPRQPGTLERDGCEAGILQPGGGFGQFGASLERADAGGAIGRAPAIEDWLGHARWTIAATVLAPQTAPRVEQRLQPVLPGHVVERVPIGGGQAGQCGIGRAVARRDQPEHQPAQHAQVGEVGPGLRTHARPGAIGRGHVSSSWGPRTCR